MKRPDVTAAGLRASAALGSDEFAAAHPNLWEHLVCTTWEDGGARETSTLMVLVEDGRVKVGLFDRDSGRNLWTSASSLGDAFLAVEFHLAEGTGDWRVKRPAGPGQSSRKKS